MPFDLAMNWQTIVIVLVVLVVAWTVLRAVLRLTMRVFSLGCAALLILGAVLFALRQF